MERVVTVVGQLAAVGEREAAPRLSVVGSTSTLMLETEGEVPLTDLTDVVQILDIPNV